MTTLEMLELIYQRTKISDDTKRLRELRAAYSWAVVEIFKSADGPQLLMKVGEELPALAAVTRDFDLETALVGGSLLGLETLWVKLSTDTRFLQLIPRGVTDAEFLAMDSSTVADPQVASGYPIFYAVTNAGQVRFAPSLPIGAILRADYAILGPAPDPTTNPTQEDGTDIPSLFHNAMVNYAVSMLFLTLDDDRAVAFAALATSTLTSAIYAAGKGTRTQRPVQTRPFRRASRRRMI